MAELEDRSGGDVPDAGGSGGVRRGVVWVVAERSHQRIENTQPVAWEDVDRRPVGGEADRGFLVGSRVLAWRAAERGTKPRSDGVVVVCGPGIVDAGVNDGQGPRDHRRAELRVSDSLQRGCVPAQHDAVGGLRRSMCPSQVRNQRERAARAGPFQKLAARNRHDSAIRIWPSRRISWKVNPEISSTTVVPGPPACTVAVNGTLCPAPRPVTVAVPCRTAVLPVTVAELTVPVTYIALTSKLPLSEPGASARHSKAPPVELA